MAIGCTSLSIRFTESPGRADLHSGDRLCPGVILFGSATILHTD